MASPVWHNSVGGGQAGALLPGLLERLLQTWPDTTWAQPIELKCQQRFITFQSSHLTTCIGFSVLPIRTFIQCCILCSDHLRKFLVKSSPSLTPRQHYCSMFPDVTQISGKLSWVSGAWAPRDIRVAQLAVIHDWATQGSWPGSGCQIQSSLRGAHTDLTLGPGPGSAHWYSSEAERNKVSALPDPPDYVLLRNQLKVLRGVCFMPI